MTLNQRRVIVFSAVLIGIPTAAFIITKIAQGYKPDFSKRTLLPSGLLVATSLPDGAQILINGKLKSATNDTLNLSPAEYDVEIKKDGYYPWKKKFLIRKEIVKKTDAFLFSTFPDLKALTFTGANNPLLSPDGLKVAYLVASASADKRGLWVLDLSDRPIVFSREPRQIVASTLTRDFSSSQYQWSADSKQLLVKLPIGSTEKTTKPVYEYFLLEGERFNPSNSLINISPNVELLLENWQKEKDARQQAKINKLPQKLLEAIDRKVKDIRFSLDESKILYTATASASIPKDILPPQPAASNQPESRNLEADKVYVYDLKEDKNFALPVDSENFSWFPTSKHILVVHKDKIGIIEYDGNNRTDIYTGPFENSFVFPFPSADRLLLLTSIGKDTPPNLYAVSLR